MENTFDSDEEKYFSWYLEELKEAGYIKTWYRFEDVQKPFKLTDGLKRAYIVPMKRVEDKVKEQALLNPSIYTPDFSIIWTEKAIGIFVADLNVKFKGRVMEPFICQDKLSIIETKGNHDHKNMTRLAINNIKFTYQRYGVYVNMTKIPAIFNTTFTPSKYLKTDKTKRKRKLNYKNVRTLSQFITSVQK